MDGVRVAWKELKVAFGVFVRWVSRDLVGEPATSAQGIDVVGKLFDLLSEECKVLSPEVGSVLSREFDRIRLWLLFFILLHFGVIGVGDGFYGECDEVDD